MKEQHLHFLQYVRQYVSENPDSAPYVSDFVAKGLQGYIGQLTEAKSNMEVALAAMVHRKYGDRDGFVKQKIQECGNMVSLNWDWFLVNDKDA